MKCQDFGIIKSGLAAVMRLMKESFSHTDAGIRYQHSVFRPCNSFPGIGSVDAHMKLCDFLII